MQPVIQHFFHSATFTLTYVVSCPTTKECVIIDPVLDFDLFSGNIACESAQEIIEYIKQNNFKVKYSLETHAHADHVTGASYLKKHFNCNIACSERITEIQTEFKSLFNFESFTNDGHQFDVLLNNNDRLHVGTLEITVLSTPGHTPDSVTYVIGKNAFIGDTLFMPDSGSARCDFPGGSAALLYQSIQRIYALGDDTMLYMCHDYQPNGRELKYQCSVAEQKQDNIQIDHHVTEIEYINKREQRDAGLSVPRLIYPSLQLNINAGKLPQPESNQQRYLKIPLTVAKELN